VPNAKFIVTVRNPVLRAFSHWCVHTRVPCVGIDIGVGRWCVCGTIMPVPLLCAF
jgi:hypothetical protein